MVSCFLLMGIFLSGGMKGIFPAKASTPALTSLFPVYLFLVYLLLAHLPH